MTVLLEDSCKGHVLPDCRLRGWEPCVLTSLGAPSSWHDRACASHLLSEEMRRGQGRMLVHFVEERWVEKMGTRSLPCVPGSPQHSASVGDWHYASWWSFVFPSPGVSPMGWDMPFLFTATSPVPEERLGRERTGSECAARRGSFCCNDLGAAGQGSSSVGLSPWFPRRGCRVRLLCLSPGVWGGSCPSGCSSSTSGSCRCLHEEREGSCQSTRLQALCLLFN